MERSIVTFPANFLTDLNCSWDIDWRSEGLGDTTEGITRTMFGGFPRWIGTPQTFLYRGDIPKLRAIRAMGQGRRNMFKVAMYDPAAFALSSVGTPGQVANGVLTSDGNTFSNGLGTEFDPFATATTAFARGAEEIRIDVASCGGVAPVQGQIMSANLWPFVVTYVSHVADTRYDIGIQMPLREAIVYGDIIKMRGEGLFEMAAEGEGNPAYGAGQFAQPSFSLIEVLAR